MSRTRNQVQGSADGLCGIYCLVNFMQRQPRCSTDADLTKAQASFYSFLKSADRTNPKLLTAAHIAGGYYAADLVKIFNETARRKRLRFQAHELDDLAKALEEESAFDLLASVFRDGGQAIVDVYAGTHWVLAHDLGPQNTILVHDSGHTEKYRKDELKRAPRTFDGVALLPKQSKLNRVMKLAQKN